MAAQRYATRTDVAVEDSRADIEELLRDYGATEYVSGWGDGRAFLAFCLCGRSVRMPIPMPTLASCSKTPAGKRRGAEQARRAYDQALRARWRAVLLVVKAKLEACAVGISTIEREFLWDLAVQREGRTTTVGELLARDLNRVLTDGATPRLLPEAPVAEGEFDDDPG